MILTLSILYAVGTIVTFITLGARYAPQTGVDGAERTVRDFYSIVIGLVWPVTLVWMLSSTFGERMVPVLERLSARREVAQIERTQVRERRAVERQEDRDAKAALKAKKAQEKEDARIAKETLAREALEADKRAAAAADAERLEEEANAAQKATADLLARVAVAKAAANTGTIPAPATSANTVPDITETAETPVSEGNEEGPFTADSTETTTDEPVTTEPVSENIETENVVTPENTTETPTPVDDPNEDPNRFVGPSRSVAFDNDKPTKAARRFAAKHNRTVDDLVIEEVPGQGERVVIYLNQPTKETVEATS